MEKKSFILSIIALATSIITLAVIFIRVTPNSVVDLGTFIGIMAAFVGICVTILVGFQIYNAVEMQQKIKDVEKNLKKELGCLEQKNKEVEEGFYIMQARIAFMKPSKQPNALFKMLNAILIALDVDHKSDGYKWMLEELEEYMLLFTSGTFIGSPSQIKTTIDEIKSIYLDIDWEIKRHANYAYIKSEYDPLMSKFGKRLELLAQGKEVSPEILDQEI